MTNNNCKFRQKGIGNKPTCLRGNNCVSIEYKCNIYEDKNKLKIDINILTDLLLNQNWMKECVIEEKDNRILVRYPNDFEDTFLRYSKGPAQGFFWDIYGEDMHSSELALLALSKAPVPLNYRKAEYPIRFRLKKENR